MSGTLNPCLPRHFARVRMTLAQREGLVPAPERSLTQQEWDAVHALAVRRSHCLDGGCAICLDEFGVRQQARMCWCACVCSCICMWGHLCAFVKHSCAHECLTNAHKCPHMQMQLQTHAHQHMRACCLTPNSSRQIAQPPSRQCERRTARACTASHSCCVRLRSGAGTNPSRCASVMRTRAKCRGKHGFSVPDISSERL